MARRNRTNKRPQRIKHNIEDRMARRAVHIAVEQSYRDEARQETYISGKLTQITFTDPSFSA